MLRLPPADFWRATPLEIATAARGLGGRAGAPAPLPRAGLDRLMARYPDTEDGSNGER